MGKNDSRNFVRRNQLGAPIAGVLVVLIALVGISVSQAGVNDSQTATSESEKDEPGFFAKRWHHSRRGHYRMRGGEHDPQRAKEHMQYAAGWMLNRLDVEDEARDQIQARLDAAFDELAPLMEGHREGRITWLEAMLRDDIDRGALEAQRLDAMAVAGEASEIVVSAMADVAELLTPEQRAELLDRIRDHHGH